MKKQDIYLCYCHPADPHDRAHYRFMTEYSYVNHKDDEAEVGLTVKAVIPFEDVSRLITNLEMCAGIRDGGGNLIDVPDMFDESEDDHEPESWQDYEERMKEEEAETASNCTCGAWIFTKSGEAVHIADCICGAG